MQVELPDCQHVCDAGLLMREGCSGRLGLADVSYYLQDGWTRSHCIAQRSRVINHNGKEYQKEFYIHIYARVCDKPLQSCLTLCSPIDCSPPDSSVHRILLARRLQWVAISYSRGSSQPGDRNRISYLFVGMRVLCHQRYLGSPLYIQKYMYETTAILVLK